MATNISSKFDSVTSKVLIRPGSPNVYKLIPERKDIGTITRKTLGQKNVMKVNKTILLVGETGTGKSTLINALVNYTMGVKWEDNVWFEIVDDQSQSEGQKVEDHSQSQTSDVVVYEIFGFEDQTLPFSLTIIDTPGYGDTRGLECDDIVSERLLDLFSSNDGVREINVVGLVLKASENRVSDRLRYIFDSVLSLFGKDMEKNIVALITHSTGRKPKNVLSALEAANIKCVRDETNQPVYFLFDNCQSEDRTEDEDEEDLEHAGKITEKGMKQFTDFLEKQKAQQQKTTVDVLNERIRLKSCIENLQEKIEFIEKKQKEIKETKKKVQEHEKEMEKNKYFKVIVTETYKDLESYDGGRKWWALGLIKTGTVRCTRCEENCHYDCKVAWGAVLCKVIAMNDCCTVCTGKCHVDYHTKEAKRYVTTTRTVEKTLDEMKEKYDKNKEVHDEGKSLLEHLQEEMKDLQKQKDQWLDQSFQHILRLEQIALNVDSLSIHVHLDFLIKRMEEKGDKDKIQKLKEVKSRADEGMKAGMKYKEGAGK